ncbi:hypothetical protein ABID92_002206 [Frigoribacterium sp. PvP120]|jgi:hypothetical protein|nr:hypothetical protein [Frigoribacterium sp. PvP121]MBP1242414.1 hypothetical protein [Frigoribacterium sp. PvP121]
MTHLIDLPSWAPIAAAPLIVVGAAVLLRLPRRRRHRRVRR